MATAAATERRRGVLGLFRTAEQVAGATEMLRQEGFTPADYDVLSGSPYPEGAFGEEHPQHRLFLFPLFGAACGFAVALLLTVGTQLAYPLVTGGKPILGVPPMFIIMYEGTMLGAILFTVIGIIFESRLPRIGVGLYDPRITEGYLGLVVACPSDRVGAVEQLLRRAGAEDVKRSTPEPV